MENLILKTGFENVISNDNSEHKLQIMSLMTVFMQNALKTANIYTKHSNRNIITSMDISLGLKKELFTFLDNDDIEERALKIYNDFKQETDEYSEEDDEEDGENDEYSEENDKEGDIDEDFKKSDCDCEVCKKTNECAELWKTWKPSNRIEEILYSSIQKIDNNY
tara:strand:- start:518 stop:1012 length:495 start_codon:yes stop_codon:yes gene_type:complete